ncbi:MAG: tRNA lysidine(34) synthetase TilS [Candidatus Marinimicrobia bacterium]|nr:tRNA lysidine(34) synthetase TilS [Candidatus Neomarinimicrobiota bacterium]
MATLYSFFSRSIYKYKLISHNNRILIAVSGGIDSLVLTHLFKRLRNSSRYNIYIEAAHVRIPETRLDDTIIEKTKKYLEEWDVPFTILDGKIREGYEVGCYTCSKERRKRLITYYYQNKFNALAVGHNEDDYIETGLLNLIYHGNLLSLSIQEYMFNKTVNIIRPLIIVKKKWITSYAKENNIQINNFNCNYGEKSQRIWVRELIKNLSSHHRGFLTNLKNAIDKWNAQFQPGFIKYEYKGK